MTAKHNHRCMPSVWMFDLPFVPKSLAFAAGMLLTCASAPSIAQGTNTSLSQIKAESDATIKALKAMQSGNYAEAEQIYTDRLNAATASGDRSKVADALSMLGGLRFVEKKYPEAEKYYKASLDALDKNGQRVSMSSLLTVSSLERTLESESKFKEAEVYMNELRQRYESASPGSVELALTLGRNAKLLKALGRNTEATAMQSRADAITNKLVPSQATTDKEMAGLQAESQHDWKKAETLYDEAVAGTQAQYGTNDSRYASALECLARVYSAEGRLDEAEKSLRTVIAIRQRTLGANDSSVGAAMMALANVLQKQHRMLEFSQMMDAANKISFSQLSKYDPKMAGALGKLAAPGSLAAAYDMMLRSNMTMLQLALQSYARTYGGKYPPSVNSALLSFLPGGGCDGKTVGKPLTNPYTNLGEWPIAGSIVDVAKARTKAPATLGAGKIEYSAIGNGTSYAIRGGGSNGLALPGKTGGTLVLSEN